MTNEPRERAHNGCEICGYVALSRLVKIKNLKLNEEWNTVQLCAEHELDWVSWGWRAFCIRFPKMRSIAEGKGWVILESGLTHPFEP